MSEVLSLLINKIFRHLSSEGVLFFFFPAVKSEPVNHLNDPDVS